MRGEVHIMRVVQTIVALTLWFVSAIIPATAQKPSPHVKIYTMDCGMFFFRNEGGYAEDGGIPGRSKMLTDPCFLIRHGADYMLWDLGTPDHMGPAHFRYRNRDVVWFSNTGLANQLAELKVSPSQIKYVAISHQDPDHIGNADLFPTAILLIDEKEYASMLGDQNIEFVKKRNEPFYSAELIAIKKLRPQLIAHDLRYDVFGDGSVVIYPTPGHRPGHRSLFVRLSNAGPIILAGDVWHIRENQLSDTANEDFTRRAIMVAPDTEKEWYKEWAQSRKMLLDLAKRENARIIIQHEPADFYSMPQFPLPLE